MHKCMFIEHQYW